MLYQADVDSKTEKFHSIRSKFPRTRSPVLGGVIVREKKTNNEDDRRKRVEFTSGIVCDNDDDENVRGKNR